MTYPAPEVAKINVGKKEKPELRAVDDTDDVVVESSEGISDLLTKLLEENRKGYVPPIRLEKKKRTKKVKIEETWEEIEE